MDGAAQQSVVEQQEHKLVLREPAPPGVGHEAARTLDRRLGVPGRAHFLRWRSFKMALGRMLWCYCAGYTPTYPPNSIIYQSNMLLMVMGQSETDSHGARCTVRA